MPKEPIFREEIEDLSWFQGLSRPGKAAEIRQCLQRNREKLSGLSPREDGYVAVGRVSGDGQFLEVYAFESFEAADVYRKGLPDFVRGFAVIDPVGREVAYGLV